VTHRLAAGLLVVVVGATGTGAGARELYRGDQVQLDFSGSLRGFGIWTRGTNAEDFSQTLTLEATRSAIVTPPGEPIECASAAVFADCVAFDLAGEENVGVGSTRLRGQLDLRVSDWLSARVAYDHRLAFGTLQTFEAQVGENLEPENLMAND
jgi:hypothetical protein